MQTTKQIIINAKHAVENDTALAFWVVFMTPFDLQNLIIIVNVKTATLIKNININNTKFIDDMFDHLIIIKLRSKKKTEMA
jgi:hypothetical protein